VADPAPIVIDTQNYVVTAVDVSLNPTYVEAQTYTITPAEVGLLVTWGPSRFETELWLDAATSIGAAATVTTWTDKSGNGYSPTQGTAGNRPDRLVANLNGKDVVSFNGTTDRLSYTPDTALLRNVQSALAFVVHKQTTVPTVAMTHVHITTVSRTTTRLQSVFSASGKYNPGGRIRDNDSPYLGVVSSATVDTNWHILAIAAKHSAGTLEPYIDGVLDVVSSTWQAPGTTSNTASGELTIGASSTPSAYNNGSIAEIIVLHNNDAVEVRQVIEGYLAWKWGLQANLPSGHPFETRQPYRTDLALYLPVTVRTYAVAWPSTQKFKRNLILSVTELALTIPTSEVAFVDEILPVAGELYTITFNILRTTAKVPVTRRIFTITWPTTQKFKRQLRVPVDTYNLTIGTQEFLFAEYYAQPPKISLVIQFGAGLAARLFKKVKVTVRALIASPVNGVTAFPPTKLRRILRPRIDTRAVVITPSNNINLWLKKSILPWDWTGCLP
jgi:hypothetical protein